MLTIITPDSYEEHRQLHQSVIRKLNLNVENHFDSTAENHKQCAYIVHYEPSNGVFGQARMRSSEGPCVSDEVLYHFGLMRRQNIFFLDQVDFKIQPLSPFFENDQEQDYLQRRFFQNLYLGMLRFSLPRLIDFMIVKSSVELYEDFVFLGCWPYKSSQRPLRIKDASSNSTTVYSIVPVDESAFGDFKIRIEGPVLSPYSGKRQISSYC
ncbi:MAG: hypothetical protein ACTHJ4_06460 [Candidatus Nucleicultricaceae bacterium]